MLLLKKVGRELFNSLEVHMVDYTRMSTEIVFEDYLHMLLHSPRLESKVIPL